MVNVDKIRWQFAEFAFRWNEKVRAGKSTPEQRENMEFARSWYIHNRHMKPGEAAEAISHEIHRQFPQRPQPEARTIVKWIKDLAPAGVSGRGRPRKK